MQEQQVQQDEQTIKPPMDMHCAPFHSADNSSTACEERVPSWLMGQDAVLKAGSVKVSRQILHRRLCGWPLSRRCGHVAERGISSQILIAVQLQRRARHHTRRLALRIVPAGPDGRRKCCGFHVGFPPRQALLAGVPHSAPALIQFRHLRVSRHR